MKTTLLTFSSLLLLLNGTGALFGGWSLMTDSSGRDIGLNLVYLTHTPFSSYFIPGLLLFVFNGILSFLVLVALLFRSKSYAKLIIAQGAVLTGWIVSQIMLVRMIYFLHFVMGAVGLALILCGILLRKYQEKEHP